MTESKNIDSLTASAGIELLTYSTPNGFKVSILLEELKEAYGRQYTTQSIDIFNNVQKESWYVKLNPNAKIPTIIDHDKGGYTVMEGIAILNYLTRNYDPEKKFTFEDPIDLCTMEQWLAFQHGNLGPLQAQANFFYRFCPERYAFPTQRFFGETERLFGILDARLKDRDYIAGPGRGKYSIADICIWPFVNSAGVLNIRLEKFPHLFQWLDQIGERPAVQKGMTVPSGKPFSFGYKAVQQRARDDPKGFEETEKPFKDALEKAQKEFGYEYKSP